jgi:hypothetical protein
VGRYLEQTKFKYLEKTGRPCADYQNIGVNCHVLFVLHSMVAQGEQAFVYIRHPRIMRAKPNTRLSVKVSILRRK